MRVLHSTMRAMAVCSVLLPAIAAAQPDPPRARVKIFRDSTATRDSSFVRVMINTDGLQQAIHEFMANKALEATIGQSLREAAAGQTGDSKRMRELTEQLNKIAQKSAALVTTIEMSCASDHQPAGYIGVQFSELQTVMGEEAPAAPLMREYPKILTVYQGSPASKAGVRQGDVVLLLDGQDARRAFQLDRLLRPMNKLPLRVQRDGSTKDFTILVEKRPPDYNSDCANVDQLIGTEFDQPLLVMRSRLPRAGAGPVFPRTPNPAAPETPAAPMAPMPPFGGYMYGFSTTNSAIAGATIMALDDDWRATLGVDNGVLVMRVLPGTPAKDAGLHNGDVITTADGQSVASVRALSRIVANATSNAVKLQIIRAGKPQVVVLRWQETPP